MPKFSFICSTCSKMVQKYVSLKTTTVICTCGATAERQLPKLNDTEIREVIDPVTGRKWKQDQQDLLKERKENYFWQVEVPRLVRTHCLETCLQEGWVYIDDRGKVCLHDKPPHKR
jgi:hypothetical protein